MPEEVPSNVFRDRQGREFECVFVVSTVVELKQSLGIDLKAIATGEAAVDLRLDDPAKLVAMLFLASREACEKHNVTPENFARLLDGGTLNAAVDALLEAAVRFLSRPQQELARAALLKAGRVQTLVAEQGARRLAAISDQALAEQVAPSLFTEMSTSSSIATNSPESAESIPRDSHSGN